MTFEDIAAKILIGVALGIIFSWTVIMVIRKREKSLETEEGREAEKERNE